MRPQFTQVLHAAASASAFITEETADSTADASADIPRNLRAIAANTHLSNVKEYLELLTRPQNLTDTNFHKFMQYSSRFFISNGKPWRQDTHGRHKIVVPKEKRYELLKEVRAVQRGTSC
jgi:hypothetical protein